MSKVETALETIGHHLACARDGDSRREIEDAIDTLVKELGDLELIRRRMDQLHLTVAAQAVQIDGFQKILMQGQQAPTAHYPETFIHFRNGLGDIEVVNTKQITSVTTDSDRVSLCTNMADGLTIFIPLSGDGKFVLDYLTRVHSVYVGKPQE